MAVFLSPVFIDAQFINAIPANGAKLFTYAAGSSTKLTTYTDNTGTTPQSNPIILNARGEPANPIWLTGGLSYDFVFTASTDSDPPVSPIRTIEDVKGVNDTTTTVDQWQNSGLTPTYVSATSFTLAGDQTSAFHVGRRIKSSVTAGTAYSTITASVFGALTTITVVNDSTVLDSGLSAVSYGILTADNPSVPVLKDSDFRVSGSVDKTKKLAFELGGLTTATTRTVTIPDKSGTMAMTSDIPTFAPRGYINGAELSTAGSSSTMSISAGVATDVAEAVLISISAISKTTSSWAVGTATGGLDTGSIANATWYHFYAIRRPDTGVVDVVFSTNATSPTLPTNYTQYRYIGSGLTNGSAQWVKFSQKGDEVLWDVPTVDFDAVNPGASAVTRTLNTPLGVQVMANIVAGSYGGSITNMGSAFTSLDMSDQAPQVGNTASLTGLSTVNVGSNTGWGLVPHLVRTNTSSQIRTRLAAGTGASDRIGAICRGWNYIR